MGFATTRWFHGRILIEIWDRTTGAFIEGHLSEHISQELLPRM